MNHKVSLSIFAIALTFSSFGQEQIVESQATQQTSQGLTYSPKMSGPDSYSFVRNTNNVILTEEQLLEMNKHRRFDKPVEWMINVDLVLLLKPFEK